MPNNLLDDFSKLDGHQDDTAFEVLKAYTNNGKDLVWTGRPRQGFFFRKSDWYFVPFSLLWGGFAIAWEISVVVMEAGILFQLWGIPFVLVGLYMMVGRFFHDAWYRKRTFYGLTKDHLIIKRPKKVQEVPFADIASIDLSEQQQRGTLSFDLGSYQKSNKSTTSKSNMAVPAMSNILDSIADANTAYEIIRTSKKAQRNTTLDLGR
jgi:hypothetical protein